MDVLESPIIGFLIKTNQHIDHAALGKQSLPPRSQLIHCVAAFDLGRVTAESINFIPHASAGKCQKLSAANDAFAALAANSKYDIGTLLHILIPLPA